MKGYTTNYVNLIADNLRDRYDNGFPILKELIQNADDAKARRLIFGRHPGFADSHHPLLQGPGLWFFNDGEFRTNDAEDLRSFGIGSKAGDVGAIGKFGLGMKSVFHLCEALFYVAWDGQHFHCEGLTPWKQEGRGIHEDWDKTTDADWHRLKSLGRELVPNGANCTWFLLWLPLRMKRHLRTPGGQETGAIIRRFPGDEPAGELAFLSDGKLAHDVAEMLPLLRHLAHVEHKGEGNSFVLRVAPHTPRLMGDPPCEQTSGQVQWADGQPRLAFSGRRIESPDTDDRFADMVARDEWPRTRYRDELGQEREEKDKASPEGAVLFCSGRRTETSSRLHWAVFLPVEDGSEGLGHNHGERGHSLILHGQFFLDAGRKRIHDHEHLHEDPNLSDVPTDESALRKAWNQILAQEMVLPLVLPTLEDHVGQHGVSDSECRELTEALSKSRWFKTFRKHICRDGVWLRTLEQSTGPRWRLADGDSRIRLRPLPKPPGSAPERPWKVFPDLAACGIVPYDAEAPYLGASDKPGRWSEQELERLLSRLDGLFGDAPSMDYMIQFLQGCAGPHLSAERVQSGFLGVLRRGLRAAKTENWHRVAAKAGRLVGFLHPERRLELDAELPESILNDLWGIDAPALLVPKGMKPESHGEASPDARSLAAWLSVLDRALDSADNEEAHQPILEAMQGLLQTLSADDRASFLRKHHALRVISVREARTVVEKPATVEYVERLRGTGCLFILTVGSRDEDRVGVAPLLARAMPDAAVCLVRAQTYRDLFSADEVQDGRLPAANDGPACLAAVGRYNGCLGEVADRRRLLEKANDPGMNSDARRGLRFLLHGSRDHRDADDAKLWIGRHDQHHAWSRLWAVMHDDARWSLVDGDLANAIPRSRWSDANVVEIDARALIDELQGTAWSIDAPEEFSIDERDEILSCIEDKDLWQHLPLHTTLAGRPVSVNHERVYLVSSAAVREGHEDPLIREATLIAPSRNELAARRQRDWLRPLDNRARIEIALHTAKPVRYWIDVMDALDRLAPQIDEDMLRLLRNTAWLPTPHDMAVKPEDVIDLQGPLGDETHRLVAEHGEANGPCFTVPNDLDDDIQNHGAWRQLRTLGFSSGAAGIERLGLLLEDLPDYRIGQWTEQPGPDAVGLLARCDELPGWRLLETASGVPFDPETTWDQLRPALSRAIEPQRLMAVLDWLSGDHDRWELRKSAYDDYLHQLAAHTRECCEHLPRLRLASADSRWHEAAELCIGAHGVVRARQLDPKQASILENFVCRAEQGARGGQPDAPRGNLQHDVAPKVLRSYFGAWAPSLVSQPMIGMMLALLGPDMRKLAKEYLHPRSFEWLVKELPWDDPGTRDRIVEWMGGKSVDEALELIQTAIRVEKEGEVEVLNLLGDPIWVALDAIDENPSTLLAGPLSWQGGYGVMIPLRRVDPDRLQPEQLSKLLRATTEQLYADLYNQKNPDFGSLWQELAESDQLEIGIARRLILDHIPFYLKQLPVQSEGIREHLKTCDSLRGRIAEAEAAENGQSTESAREKLRQALDGLAERIDGNPDEQQAVLQAVKSKLEQYQYDPSSIPLELFQNADDAAVELGECHAYPSEGGEVPAWARRFTVEERTDGLRFAHWGRPINARGPVGFNGEDRGYGRDLEKMLILSATDKLGNEGVTGKFGLGFKSVLLACDQPRVLSGRLAVRVVAGILPRPWDDAQEARQRLEKFGTDPRQPGTLIDLPGVESGLRAGVLERFLLLAGLLCVFARAVRSVTHVAAASEAVWSWEPREICPGAEVGELHLRGDWGARTRALCIRATDGSLLLALGPRGFRPLPDTVPALWVTVPTKESSAVGFALNGSFDLDAGRGRLAGDTENLNKARRIGQQAGDALGELLERSRKDWNSVRAALGLVTDLDALAFWESVWFGLTKGWLKHPRSDGKDLAREAALAALARLWECPRAVPNGLKKSLRDFSDAHEIRYELSEVLLREDVGEVLIAWERFTSRYPIPHCASTEIANILREADLCHLQSVGLPALAELLERSKVEPSDAAVLGRLRLLTEGEKDWESDDLRERLNGLLFRSEAGTWIEARKLLATLGPLDADESRRYELAPPEGRLHTDYYTEVDDERPAVVFFTVCRQRMETTAETLAQWVLDAESVEARRAAFAYLADGDLGEQVAERVREQGWLRAVLTDPELASELTDEQQHKLRRRLASANQLQRAIADERERRESPSTDERAAVFFERLADWWADAGTRQEVIDQHEKDCWPSWLREGDLAAALRGNSKEHWLAFLVLGACQSFGRTQDAQHRRFLEMADERKWWQVFLKPENDEAWMNVLRGWQDKAIDRLDYRLWLSLFPTIYQFSRYLDAYRMLIMSADRRPEKLYSAQRLLAPRTDDALSGTGEQFDAPPIPLGLGFHWCLRELARLRVLDASDHLAKDCYVPARRVLGLLCPLGLSIESNSSASDKSRSIHDFLQGDRKLHAVRPHLYLSFDIPLRHIAKRENEDLRREWGLAQGEYNTRKGDWVKSKSEMIIADLLFEHDVEYEYDECLRAPDDTYYRPDFTIHSNSQHWYWEHWGMMDDPDYAADKEKKEAWYKEHFDGRLVETFETGDLTMKAAAIIRRLKGTRG